MDEWEQCAIVGGAYVCACVFVWCYVRGKNEQGSLKGSIQHPETGCRTSPRVCDSPAWRLIPKMEVEKAKPKTESGAPGA
jgi:hypothetical protein